METESLNRAIEDYLINYSAEANLASRTVENKREILLKLQSFLGDKEYTLESCRVFLSYMYSHGWKKPNSRMGLVRVLRAFTNFLHKHKYIPENFADQLTKPKVPKEEFDYVAPEDVEKIITAGTQPGKGDRSRSLKIKEDTRAALRFVLRTGLSISELTSLKGSDLNLYDEPPTFWVRGKGGNRELLPLPKDMLEELKSRQQNERLFAVTDDTCNDVLQRGAKALGLSVKLTNHSLRHIFATSLVKNRVPIQMISRLMRHSSVEITDKTYTHLDVNDLSLVINSTQGIVVEGLTQKQIFDNIEQAVRSTGVEKDKRYVMQIQMNTNLLQITIKKNEV